MAIEYKQEKQRKCMMSVSEKTKDWIPALRRYFANSFKSDQTAASRLPTVKLLLEWLTQKDIINKKRIEDITESDLAKVKSSDIEEYLNCLKKGIGCKKNSNRTIRLKIVAFHSLWEFLVKDNIVPKNIIDCKAWCKKYKEESSNNAYASGEGIRIAEASDIEMFLRNLEKINDDFVFKRNTMIVKLYLASGIRKSELCGLDMEDIDFNNLTIKIMRKGNQDVPSVVPIPSKTMEELRDYVYMRNSIGFTSKALFVSKRTGDRLTEASIRDFFDRYSERKISPHRLRDSFASNVYDKTHNMKLIQELLGHASPITTSNNYVMSNQGTIRDAVEAVAW